MLLPSGTLLRESADDVWLEMTALPIISPSSVGNLLSKFTARKLTIARSPCSSSNMNRTAFSDISIDGAVVFFVGWSSAGGNEIVWMVSLVGH